MEQDINECQRVQLFIFERYGVDKKVTIGIFVNITNSIVFP